MNSVNNNNKELPSEKKAQGAEDAIPSQEILPKETDSKKPVEEQKTPLEEEIIETKPREETKGTPLEEKSAPPIETMPPSKEIAETKPTIKRKSKRRPKPKPRPQIPEAPKKWEEKWVEVDGKKVLFVPSGFEIMTKNGWRPIMERADKYTK